MKIEKLPNKILSGLTLLILMLSFSLIFAPSVYSLECNDGTEIDDPVANIPGGVAINAADREAIRNDACSEHGGYGTSGAANNVEQVDPRENLSKGECDTLPGQELTRDNCEIINLVVIGINFLSAIAGMAIVGSIMFAGYQYMTARDNPGAIEAAKKRIVWALVALGLFVFMYALLNYFIPGGVF